MHYAIMSEDVPQSLEKTKSARPAHLDRLNYLASQNRLVVAGPHPAIDSFEPGRLDLAAALSLQSLII